MNHNHSFHELKGPKHMNQYSTIISSYLKPIGKDNKTIVIIIII